MHLRETSPSVNTKAAESKVNEQGKVCADAKLAAAANSVRAWNQRQSIQVRYFNSNSEYKDANEKKRQK